jgi:hypothetical protein
MAAAQRYVLSRTTRPPEIPPQPPFFKGGNGGISVEALLDKEKERNVVAFFKKLKCYKKSFSGMFWFFHS